MTEYEAALAAWKLDGGPRPANRPDGFPTRNDHQWLTPAEKAIDAAIAVVEAFGASIALTEAVQLLAEARNRVADHIEGKG